MLIYVLEYEASFDRVAVIENYESCIWTERFMDAGDFKLVTSATKSNSKLLQPGVVLEHDDSSIPMLIETVEVKDNTLTASGRTIETYFNQRMIGPESPENAPFGSSSPIKPRVFTNSPGRIMGAIVDVMQTQHSAFQPIAGLRAGLIQADGVNVTKKVAAREPVYDLLLRIAKQYVVDMYVRRHPLDTGGYELVFSTRTGVRRVDGNPEGYATVRFSPKDDNFVDVNEIYSAISTVDIVFVYPPKRYSGPGQIGHTAGMGDMPFMIDENNIDSPNETTADLDLYSDGLSSYSPFQTRIVVADSEKLTVAYLQKQLYRYGYPSSKKWVDVPTTGTDNSKQRILQHEMIRMGKHEYNRTRGRRDWAVDGEAASNMFKFGRDYRLGDIVEVMGTDFVLADGTEGVIPVNKKAVFGKREAVVSEYIRSASAEGIREYPTFSEPPKPAPYDNSPSEQGDLGDTLSWTPRMVSNGGSGINEAGGWFEEGYPYLTFFRQGDLITVFGLIGWYGYANGTWTNPGTILPVEAIPEEFRPASITRVMGYGSTGGPNDSQLWSLYIYGDTGKMIVDNQHTSSGSQVYPWGTMGNNIISFNVMGSYPARELALGLYHLDTGPV